MPLHIANPMAWAQEMGLPPDILQQIAEQTQMPPPDIFEPITPVLGVERDTARFDDINDFVSAFGGIGGPETTQPEDDWDTVRGSRRLGWALRNVMDDISPNQGLMGNLWGAGTGLAENMGFELGLLNAVNPGSNLQQNAYNIAKYAVRQLFAQSDAGVAAGTGEMELSSLNNDGATDVLENQPE